jgi:hypothetical protein
MRRIDEEVSWEIMSKRRRGFRTRLRRPQSPSRLIIASG